MTEAEANSNPPTEVQDEPAVDAQQPKEEPQATPAEVKADAEEPATKEESEAKDESAEGDEKDGKSNILKTKGKIDYENHRNNRKFDPTTREVTDDPVAIRKQVRLLEDFSVYSRLSPADGIVS